MKINNFIKELETALIERGVSEETAKKHVANLSRSFTSDDLDEIEAIESSSEIAALADSIAVILNKNRKTPSANTKSTAVSEKRTNQHQPSQVPEKVEPEKVNESPQNKPKVPERKPLYSEPDPDYMPNDYTQTASNRGVTIFWVGLIVTLPITLALLAVGFGAFIAAFGGLVGIIIATVALLVATVAIGAAASLVGIIYGITQLFSFPAAGIYEIGLGIMVAGAVLFASILIYNFAIRFVPWVISWLAVFFKYSCKKLVVLFNFIRKECYKL